MSESDSMPAGIVARGLTRNFELGDEKIEVLRGVDFHLHQGERVAILGASGSGKSTLLHLLGGLDILTTGEVSIDGQRVDTLSEAKRGLLRNRRLGFVYQFHHLLSEFTASENVAMPLRIRGNRQRPDPVRDQDPPQGIRRTAGRRVVGTVDGRGRFSSPLRG